MTIWWGANDSTLPGQTQHVPLDRFRSNIRDLVSLVRDPASPYHSPETSIVLINAPSFYPEHWLDEKERKGQPREVDRDLANTKRYAEEVQSLGQELGLPVADAYAAVERAVQQVGADQPQEIWSDGLHLTGKAYAAVTAGEFLSGPLPGRSRADPLISLVYRSATGYRDGLPGQALGPTAHDAPGLEGHPSVLRGSITHPSVR